MTDSRYVADGSTPERHRRSSLAWQIHSIEQVAALSLEELEQLLAAHEAECVALAGKLEIYQDEAWAKAARRALRVLHLHKQWISRELKERKRVKALSEQEQVAVSAASARAAVHEKYAEERRRAAALKMNLVEAANNETARHISVFKKVAREVLGDAMYERLWELTRARLEGQG